MRGFLLAAFVPTLALDLHVQKGHCLLLAITPQRA